MPHTFPTTELNPWGGSPDPRRAPSPGLSKFQRDPDGRPGGRLRTRASAPQKYVALPRGPRHTNHSAIGARCRVDWRLDVEFHSLPETLPWNRPAAARMGAWRSPTGR